MARVYREERFRTPLEAERSLGLWVDRVGSERGITARPENYRVLGQFAAVTVETGEGTLDMLGAPSIHVATGDVMLIFPDTATRYRPDPQWDISWVLWNGPQAHIVQQVGYLSEKAPVVHKAATVTRRAFERLNPLMAREDRIAVLERLVTVLEMIRELNMVRSAGTPTHAAVQLAIEELMRGPLPPSPIADLARRANLTPAYFRRLFKLTTGTTPKAFQLVRRINQAKEMLATGRSIKDTSEALGFSDVFHFMRVFKKLTHQTAGQYAGTHHH